LTPLQRKLALASGVAALALIGFGATMMLTGSSHVGAPAASDVADAPVSEPAAPPVPVVAPRLAEAPASPPPSALPALSPSASSVAGKPTPTDRELDEEQKKKDKRRRMGPAAPNGAARNPDYGI
ncbi:MAG TPA: hypothetical protein VEQ58_02860, partial [Polyangiaceae bacterium]|nr:hypothetical protein [Polyangiaceae bacterium]